MLWWLLLLYIVESSRVQLKVFSKKGKAFKFDVLETLKMDSLLYLIESATNEHPLSLRYENEKVDLKMKDLRELKDTTLYIEESLYIDFYLESLNSDQVFTFHSFEVNNLNSIYSILDEEYGFYRIQLCEDWRCHKEISSFEQLCRIQSERIFFKEIN